MIAEIFQREKLDGPESAAFRAHINERKFHARQFFLLAGVLFYASYAYLDHLVTGSMGAQFVFLRLAVISPLMLAIALLFALGYCKGRESLAFLAYMMLMLGSVFYMCLVVDKPAADIYPFGMIVIIFSMCMLVLPSFKLTALMATMIVILLGVLIRFSKIGMEGTYASIYFVGMCCVVLAVGMFFLENTERRQYVYKRDLERSIETLKASEKRAIGLYHEAKQAERAKNEFLAVVSHELRTPMNAIIGFSEIISTEMLGKVEPQQYREYATHINTSGMHLLKIINDILDISRADMDKITFTAHEFDLVATFETALSSCSANADETGIAIAASTGPITELLCQGDESRIVQAVVNILGNAIKFSKQGGTINADLSVRHDGSIAIVIKDCGIGISPEDIEQIKKPFQQAESAFVRNNGGLGLGLAIANIVVHAHGGSVEIESLIGVGTTVSIVLPPECLLSLNGDGRGMGGQIQAKAS